MELTWNSLSSEESSCISKGISAIISKKNLSDLLKLNKQLRLMEFPWRKNQEILGAIFVTTARLLFKEEKINSVENQLILSQYGSSIKQETLSKLITRSLVSFCFHISFSQRISFSCSFSSHRIRATKIKLEMNKLPENVKILLKEGIVSFSSQDLLSFMETSYLLGYHWIDEDQTKRERVFAAIIDFYSPDRKPPPKKVVAKTTAMVVRNLAGMEISWTSLPVDVQQAVYRGMKFSASSWEETQLQEVETK
jgi:hypothetical protein